MISDSELARSLFPKPKRVLSDAMGGAEPVTTTVATAVSDSESGRVRVDFGGATESADDEQAVEIPCSSAIREGDTVLVTLDGTTPVDAVVMGAGDGIRREIAATAEGIAATVEKKVDASDSITAIGSVMEQTADGLDIFSTVNGARSETHAHIDDDEFSVVDGDGKVQIGMSAPPGKVPEVTFADGAGSIYAAKHSAASTTMDALKLDAKHGYMQLTAEEGIRLLSNYVVVFADTEFTVNAPKVSFNGGIGTGGFTTAPGTVLLNMGDGWYGGKQQTRTFSRPISSCMAGVVFVWSHYTGSDTGWESVNCVFVPKFLVQQGGSKSVCFHLADSLTTSGDTSNEVTKYLTITDTTVTGVAGNVATNAQKYWALRRVISV